VRAELAALDLRRLTWRRAWAGIYRVHLVFNEHDLLSYASSIAFQVLYAVVPLIMLGLGALGLLGEEGVYVHHVAPVLRRDMSADVFKVVDRTALRMMTSERYYWTTAGLLVTIWGISGSIRAMFVPLNRIYRAEETRTFPNRMATSFLVAVIVIVCVYGALALSLGGRLLHPHEVVVAAVVLVGRWALTVGLILLAIAAIVRLAPARRLDFEWVSIGAVLAAASWIGATALFSAYVSVVSYTSLYGVLAVIVVLLAYLYYSAVSLLFGIVVDSLLRDQVRRTQRRRR
jgi:membrane protein